jgi:hypothetical protein
MIHMYSLFQHIIFHSCMSLISYWKKKRKFLIYGTHAGCKLRRIQHRSKSLGGQEVPRRVPLPCSGRHLIWYYPEQFYRGGSTSSLSVMRKEYSNHITTELVCVK